MAEVEVYITIDETKAPADLFTRAQDEDFKRIYYSDLADEDAVRKHWAHNAIANNIQDVSRLDGWAELPRGVVTMRIADVEMQWA